MKTLSMFYSRESDSRIANVRPSVCLSVTKTTQPLRIKPVCLSKSCLLIIMPIDHKAHELSDLLSRLLSLSACFFSQKNQFLFRDDRRWTQMDFMETHSPMDLESFIQQGGNKRQQM